MADAQIAAGHFEPDGYGDARKFCVNLYPEPNGGDPQRKVRLVNTPGSVLLDDGDTLTTAVRGLFQADGYAGGKLVVPDGVTVRLYDPVGGSWTALSGSISGTDRVRGDFSEVQFGLIAGGALFVSASAGTSIAAASDADWATLLSDAGATGFTSIVSLGQRAFVSYKNRIGYSDALQFNTTTTLNYYVSENTPDDIVGLGKLGNQLLVFGTQSIDPYFQTGNNDGPIQPIPTQAIARGCAAVDSLVNLDNGIFFVGDDRAVYRTDGISAQIMNPEDPWVTRVLQAVAEPADIVCYGIETEAHKFYTIRTPARCMVYDIMMQSWHLRQTYGSLTWEWMHLVQVASKTYAANDATTLVELSRAYKSDRMADAATFGTEIVHQFTAHLPVKQGANPIGQIRIEGTKGIGLATGQGSDPVIERAISRDKGNTFGPFLSRSLGKIGEYGARTSWEQNGLAVPEQTVLLFRWSDPVGFLPSRVAIGER